MEVLRRIAQARGRHLHRYAIDIDWPALGKRIGFTRSTVRDVENGRPLRLTELRAIATVYECSAGWLAFGEGVIEAPGAKPTPVPGVPFDTGRPAYEAIAEEVATRQREAEAADPPDRARSARVAGARALDVRKGTGRRPKSP